MKTKGIFILVSVLILMFGIWFFLHKKVEVETAQPVILNSQNQSNKSVIKNRQVVSTTPSTSKATNTSSISEPSVPITVQEYVQKIKADPQYDWKQPINFYGRVVDESNEPVADASVHFEWNDISEKGTSDADAVSDGNGFFSLTDRRGKRLYVEVGKEGYYSSGNSRSSAFEYANPADGLFTPDQNNPVVFHLRKKGQGADLIHRVQLFGFRTNGPVQYLDLLQGKNTLTPPGDLAVQFTRGSRNSNAKYDWSVTISVPDGGLFESDDEFMFEAPTDDYQPTIKIQQTADDPRWVSGGKIRFYFRSRNGSIYGRAEATIYPHYQNGAAIDLNYYVNPSGSSNLEPK